MPSAFPLTKRTGRWVKWATNGNRSREGRSASSLAGGESSEPWDGRVRLPERASAVDVAVERAEAGRRPAADARDAGGEAPGVGEVEPAADERHPPDLHRRAGRRQEIECAERRFRSHREAEQIEAARAGLGRDRRHRLRDPSTQGAGIRRGRGIDPHEPDREALVLEILDEPAASLRVENLAAKEERLHDEEGNLAPLRARHGGGEVGRAHRERVVLYRGVKRARVERRGIRPVAAREREQHGDAGDDDPGAHHSPSCSRSQATIRG